MSEAEDPDEFRSFFWTLMVSLAAGKPIRMEDDMSEKTDDGIPEVNIDLEVPFPGCFMWRTDCMKCGVSIQAPMRVDVPGSPSPILCNDCGGKGWILVSKATEMARERLGQVLKELGVEDVSTGTDRVLAALGGTKLE